MEFVDDCFEHGETADVDDGLPKRIIVQDLEEHVEFILFRSCLFLAQLLRGFTTLLTMLDPSGTDRAGTNFHRDGRYTRLLRVTGDGQIDIGVFKVDTGCNGGNGFLRVGSPFATNEHADRVTYLKRLRKVDHVCRDGIGEQTRLSFDTITVGTGASCGRQSSACR